MSFQLTVGERPINENGDRLQLPIDVGSTSHIISK